MNAEERETNKKRGKPEHDNSFEEQTVFRKSRKVNRTPPKETNINKEQSYQEEESMEEIKNMFREIKEELQNMSIKVETTNEEVKEMRTEINKLKEEWKQEKKELIEELGKTQRRLEVLEKDKIRNNLTITGIAMENSDSETLKVAVENMLKTKINVQAKVKAVYKIGPQRCIAEMENWTEKLNVLRNKKNLKGEEIYIDSEMTAREREIQKHIRDIARNEKAQGKTAKVMFQKIEINGVMMKWDKKENALKPPEPKN